MRHPLAMSLMTTAISRREFGKRIAALTSAAAFLPQVASCSAPQSLSNRQALLAEFRKADAALLAEDGARQAAAEDFGGIIHRLPLAVIRPRSESDIVKAIRFAKRHTVQVAMRGQGHSMLGQCQVEQGIVIDSSTLNSVRMVTYDDRPAIEAGAGALWGAMLDAAYAEKLTPPVNVDPGYLSVGGTLSTGGFGGRTWDDGFQIDHVLQLQVVTGEGRVVTCSDRRNTDLFNSILGGMGQTGLIVKAIIPLVAAPMHVRFFMLGYDDLPTAMADMTALSTNRRFKHLDGRSAVREGGGFTYNLEAGYFYDAPSAPADTELLGGLKFASNTVSTMTYEQYYRREAPLKPGRYPWLYLCLPASQFLQYAADVFANPEEHALSVPRFSVWNRDRVKRPLARLPNEDFVVRFQLSRMPPSTFTNMESLLRSNRALYERARDVGGTRLTTSALPFSQADWMDHYGPVWPWLSDMKKYFDPNRVLTPGPGMFPPMAL
ncbi:MAG: cytokinin dehydrogenase [Betaproteobacteria bacterium]|nr:cytokinin dehydrogenase [Betaproteobacteria bacterium]